MGKAEVESAIADAPRRTGDVTSNAGTLTAPALLDHHLQVDVQFLCVGLETRAAPSGFLEALAGRHG